jgi:GNAT superfamily N-acetyltransferase
MEVHRFERVEEFRTMAEPLLRAQPARNQLPIAIVHTLSTQPSVYREFRLWASEDDGTIAAAAVRTPPHNVALADPLEGAGPEALDALVEVIADQDPETPGVVANRPWSAWFADRWTARTGERWRTSVAQGVYELTRPRSPRPSPGSARRAGPDDADLVRAWMDAFADEALPPELAERSRQFGRLDGQLDDSQDSSGIWLWEDEGRATSMTGFTTIPVGARIGPVFTPKDERGRGFASNLVAFASAWHLDRGAHACFLYTDLANPTSNKVYTDLGYVRVCESDNIEFVRT